MVTPPDCCLAIIGDTLWVIECRQFNYCSYSSLSSKEVYYSESSVFHPAGKWNLYEMNLHQLIMNYISWFGNPLAVIIYPVMKTLNSKNYIKCTIVIGSKDEIATNQILSILCLLLFWTHFLFTYFFVTNLNF